MFVVEAIFGQILVLELVMIQKLFFALYFLVCELLPFQT